MNNKFTSAFILIFFLSLGFITAQGLGVPHQFYGNAVYNGAGANGLIIDVYIDGTKVGNTTTLNGRYGYSPIFYIKDPDGIFEGKTIIFYLNGVDTGQTYNFFNGASTKLDLSSTGTTPSQPPTGGNGGGSGGGGGGSSGGGSGTTTPKTTTTTSTTGGTGSQESGIEENETETTSETQMTTEQQGFFASITGAVTGAIGTPATIGVLIFIIAVVAVYIYVNVMRKRAGK